MPDYNNKASLWFRLDGAKSQVGGDRTPPLFSGVLNVDGIDLQISAWHGVPRDLDDDAKQAIVAFRKASAELAKALGADLGAERPGGSPVLRMSVSPRYGQNSKSRKTSSNNGEDLSSIF